MCRLLTPNLSTTVTCQTAARQHSAEKGGRVRERERQSAAASRRILLRKKLSFSKALKNNSESLSAQEGTPETHTLEADSHSILENSIPIPSVVSTPSPSMVAVGLVRQSDLPLSWLDPTAVFSCNGLYVPRETRNTLRRSLSKGSEESSRANSFNLSSEEDIDSKGPDPRGITAASKKSLPCAASPSPRTPTYLGINISPVVRLNRCLLLIPGSSHGNQSASANRRRRTSSVPKDVLCSLSKDSVAGEENKENKSTADTERLTRIKSSHSLPSSPVVLCTKLPLLRCHDSSQPAPLSLALSPKLVQQKLRDAQESARTANETHKDNTVSTMLYSSFFTPLFCFLLVHSP